MYMYKSRGFKGRPFSCLLFQKSTWLTSATLYMHTINLDAMSLVEPTLNETTIKPKQKRLKELMISACLKISNVSLHSFKNLNLSQNKNFNGCYKYGSVILENSVNLYQV